MANVIKIRRGSNEPTPRRYVAYVYTTQERWDIDRSSLYEKDNDTDIYTLTQDIVYANGKTYYTLEGELYSYELGYRTDQGGGRIYLNDNNTVVQIGRKIFVQGTEPTSAQSVEGDLWVDTSSL